jgi:hypothetical protein
MLTAVRGSGKPMMNGPQLWKLRVIILQCEERVHHTGSDSAPLRAASILLLHSGHWWVAQHHGGTGSQLPFSAFRQSIGQAASALRPALPTSDLAIR